MWFFLLGNVYVARMQNRILNSVVQKISNSINGLPTYLVQLDSIDIVILTVTQVPALERTSCGDGISSTFIIIFSFALSCRQLLPAFFRAILSSSFVRSHIKINQNCSKWCVPHFFRQVKHPENPSNPWQIRSRPSSTDQKDMISSVKRRLPYVLVASATNPTWFSEGWSFLLPTQGFDIPLTWWIRNDHELTQY